MCLGVRSPPPWLAFVVIAATLLKISQAVFGFPQPAVEMAPHGQGSVCADQTACETVAAAKATPEPVADAALAADSAAPAVEALPPQDAASNARRAAELMQQSSAAGPGAAPGPEARIPEDDPPQRLGPVTQPAATG